MPSSRSCKECELFVASPVREPLTEEEKASGVIRIGDYEDGICHRYPQPRGLAHPHWCGEFKCAHRAGTETVSDVMSPDLLVREICVDCGALIRFGRKDPADATTD